MKISAKKIDLIKENIDTLVYFVFEEKMKLPDFLKEFDKKVNGQLSDMISQKIITGKIKELNYLYSCGLTNINRIVFYGLGKREKCTLNTIRKNNGEMSRALKKESIKSVHFILPDIKEFSVELISQAIIEGLLMGSYEYNVFKSKEKKLNDFSIEELVVCANDEKQIPIIDEKIKQGKIFAQAVNLSRDLANTPSNYLTPALFVKKAQELVSNTKVSLSIIDQKQAKDFGMGAFLGVAKGSINEPYMLVLKYQGSKNKNEQFSALIGKGVTFDSGGISLKPSEKMGEMKGDMSAAANVLASILALAEIKVERNIMAIIPLAENMPSGRAQKPGDIVTAMNGKTIEIINTDAEGRLILADAICYAVSLGVKEIIDMATLTGACLVALGDVASAILGNNQQMVDKMLTASKITGEKLWQLPLFDEYLEYLESDIADIANCAEERLAGTANASKFLEQFVNDLPWVHIDIAGTSHSNKNKWCNVKGMTAEGTRNLINYFL